VAHQIDLRARGDRLLLVFQSKEEAFKFLSTRFSDLSRTYISEKGVFTAALSGGRTPVGFYAELGRMSGQVDWKSVHVFMVDERFVPATDIESNYGMIKKTLIDAVPIPPTHVHPIITDTSDPWASARRYEETLSKFFNSRPGVAPMLDFILLGLGEDGHTASLFPGFPSVTQQNRLVQAVAPAAGRVARITLTLETINNGRHVVFLATGKGKAYIVKRVIVDRDEYLPATRVAPRDGEVTFVCDREAAALVDPKHIESEASWNG
jgi:6-phosphogluconolactonase